MITVRARRYLSACAPEPGLLERQRPGWQQLLDGGQQLANRMSVGGMTQILRGDVQVDLGAGDEPVAEQVADGDQAHAGPDQVGGERVP